MNQKLNGNKLVLQIVINTHYRAEKSMRLKGITLKGSNRREKASREKSSHEKGHYPDRCRYKIVWNPGLTLLTSFL